jgi:RNA polymerase sigma-70 factor (ECF subfamily)
MSADVQPPGDEGSGPDSLRRALEASTNELVRRAKADQRHFAELYARVAPAILAWVHVRLGPAARRRLDPEDVVQEVWLRALKAFPGFDPARGNFRCWIFKVTKYELLDTFRWLAAASRRGEQAAAPESRAAEASAGSAMRGPIMGPGPRRERSPSQIPDDVSSFTRRIAREEGLLRFLGEVESLPEADRELLLICGFEGRPTTEAAELLELSHEAAAKRWQRLRQRLSQRTGLAALID